MDVGGEAGAAALGLVGETTEAFEAAPPKREANGLGMREPVGFPDALRPEGRGGSGGFWAFGRGGNGSVVHSD